ncbi:MAG TPA: bifunctional hydroxymethylpyrimidine kinase/phosphomethylpyrimidine kinase [Polyangiaceae bacterium]|nr:bifunctional hydroxymethylpyrimidine kinase/phosphomethylpyrimidine kinase [Polyangiaceae bacterium]
MKARPEQEHTKPRILVVAGSDSGGGAGIQADIKTITMLGGFAMTAVTALTAQNTLGVEDVLPIDPRFVALQMKSVLTDIGADAIKTGMLGSARVVEAVAAVCESTAFGIPLVVDPVMVAKGGARLLDKGAHDALVLRLLPLASLLTPNVPEAEVLTGMTIKTTRDLERAADALLALGPSAVLMKGGHLEGDTVVDLLRTADGAQHVFEGPRIISRSTHGTGCTLASAIAAGIAEGLTLQGAVARARDYVVKAIRLAPGLGKGHGPLEFAHPLLTSQANEVPAVSRALH